MFHSLRVWVNTLRWLVDTLTKPKPHDHAPFCKFPQICKISPCSPRVKEMTSLGKVLFRKVTVFHFKNCQENYVYKLPEAFLNFLVPGNFHIRCFVVEVTLVMLVTTGSETDRFILYNQSKIAKIDISQASNQSVQKLIGLKICKNCKTGLCEKIAQGMF